MNKSRSIGVEICPNLPELLGKLVVEHARLLNLCLVVALQNDRYKQLQEDQTHNEVVASKVGICQALTTTA